MYFYPFLHSRMSEDVRVVFKIQAIDHGGCHRELGIRSALDGYTSIKRRTYKSREIIQQQARKAMISRCR